MQPPVKHGGAHRLLRGGRRVGFDRERCLVPAGVIRRGLGDTPEHQADAHARRKQHGEPGNGTEIGCRSLAAQPDLANRQKDQRETEDHENVATEHEQPVERSDRPPLGTVESALGRFRRDKHTQHEQQYQARRNPENRVMEIHPPSLEIVLPDLVIGFV